MTKTYKCETCGKFDVEVKMSDPELKECPTCGKEVQRIFMPTPSIWKTSGAFGKSK